MKQSLLTKTEILTIVVIGRLRQENNEVERMNKHGFSLMEVIIAALILALTAGGVLYMFSTGKGTTARSGHQIQAMDFTRQTLEELKNAVSADTWPNAGNLAAGVDKPAPITNGGDFTSKFHGDRKYTVNDVIVMGDTIYKNVTVTVDWTEPD